jgi:hypothetical protein
MNGRIFAVNGILPCLAAFPPPPTATQPPHLDVGENEVAVRDDIYTKEPFLGRWPVLRHKTGIISHFLKGTEP